MTVNGRLVLCGALLGTGLALAACGPDVVSSRTERTTTTTGPAAAGPTATTSTTTTRTIQ